MAYPAIVDSMISRWNFVREHTLEILSVLDDGKLQFKPEGPTWQPLYWEFACIGRTQLVYTKAVETGLMDFSYFSSPDLPKKENLNTKEVLIKFLTEADAKWMGNLKVRKNSEDYTITWPEGMGQTALAAHIMSLAEHERLHHGQFISYFTLAGFTLPPNFKQHWDL